MNRLSLAAMRLFVVIIRIKTKPIADWFFSRTEITVPTPVFGHILPARVARTTTHRQLCLLCERFIAERFILEELLASGDRVVDVGANIGYHTLLFEDRVGRTGQILCIEPEPDNLIELRDTIAANRLENIEIIDKAIGERKENIRLRRGINSGVTHDESEDSFAVETIRLDDLVDFRPDFIKIDVEGFEGQALAGGQELLADQKPRLFVEVHPKLLRFGYTVDAVFDLVRPHYKNIRFYQLREPVDRLGRLIFRYSDGCREIGGIDQVLADCGRGELRAPFWMICT